MSELATQDSQAPELLYGMDEAVVMIPYDWCDTRSKAAYRGWQELDAVSMIDSPFDPRDVTVRVRWMFRWTADPWAELTHRYGDAWTPGAFKVWAVTVNPWAPRTPKAALPDSRLGGEAGKEKP